MDDLCHLDSPNTGLNLSPIQVNTSLVNHYSWSNGTLLQTAVYEQEKQDFVRMLLDYGFVCFLCQGVSLKTMTFSL